MKLTFKFHYWAGILVALSYALNARFIGATTGDWFWYLIAATWCVIAGVLIGLWARAWRNRNTITIAIRANYEPFLEAMAKAAKDLKR